MDDSKVPRGVAPRMGAAYSTKSVRSGIRMAA